MSGNLMWAPWRAAFILGEKEQGCIFCNRYKMEDSVENLILYRGQKTFIILNKYPYNTGHAMIVPVRHVAELEDLRADEAAEMMELTQRTVVAIKNRLKPHSMNCGMNLGESAGAGIPGHVHMHVVPRWNGDTNFMPVIGKTHVISIPLEPVYDMLREELNPK